MYLAFQSLKIHILKGNQMFAMLKTMIASALSAVKQQQVADVANKMAQDADNFDAQIEESRKKAARMAARGTPKMDSASKFRPSKGDFMASHLQEMKSTRAVNTIASLAVWIALAKGFGAWTTPKTAKNAELRHTRIVDAMEEFHAWNICHRVEEKWIKGAPVMVDGKWNMEQCENTLIKLSYTEPLASTGPAREALTILARVRGQSIEELLNARKKVAEEATINKMEQITAFLNELWSFHIGEESNIDPKIDLDKAIAKIEQTLSWVAGWNTSTEQGQLTQISELILLEEEIKFMRTLRPAGDKGERFVDGIATSDSVMYREDWDFREGTQSSRGDGRSRNVD
jgi:hypothetical protein